jgi:hypothetical protein
MPQHARYQFMPAPVGEFQGHLVFSAKDFGAGTLSIRAHSPEVRQGALMTLWALAVTAVSSFWYRRRSLACA